MASTYSSIRTFLTMFAVSPWWRRLSVWSDWFRLVWQLRTICSFSGYRHRFRKSSAFLKVDSLLFKVLLAWNEFVFPAKVRYDQERYRKQCVMDRSRSFQNSLLISVNMCYSAMTFLFRDLIVHASGQHTDYQHTISNFLKACTARMVNSVSRI